MRFNVLRNPVLDGDQVIIKDNKYKIMMTICGFSVRNSECVLISELKYQVDICRYLNDVNAIRV